MAVDDQDAPVNAADPDLLRESLESLSEGLAIYGADFRLIASNRRYAEMLHPIADLISPGAVWQDLLRACAERGVYANTPDDVDDWLERMTREPWTRLEPFEIEQADGRCYTASYRPTSFGGFVVTRIDVTERRRAEAMIRDREALFATVLDTIPVAIVMARLEDGRIAYRSGEALKDFSERVEFARECFVNPKDRFPYIDTLRRDAMVEDHRADLRRRDGSVFHASLSGRLVAYGGEQYVVTAISDMTERLGQEELLRHVVDACPTPLMMTRLDSGEVLFSSPEARALFGEPQSSKILYAEPGARERYVEELRQKGAVHEYKVQLQKQTGEPFWSASSSRVIRYRGEDVIVSHMRDLTEQAAIEEELAAQRETLFQNEKLSAMGELLAGVAHELNNPLSVVVGHAQMLLDDTSDPRVRRHTEQIGAAAARCARIVKTFLTMARQQPSRTEIVAVNDLVRDALGVVRYGDKVRIDWDLARGLPSIAADPDQITQVIVNLVLNAEQAIRGSGRGDHIILRSRLATVGEAIELEVEDNGPGIPEEVRGRIFEPFFTTKAVGEGTGIGLALSHRIIHSHKGEIRLDAAFREGTRFRITLPAVGDATARTAAAAAPADSERQAARILVVDDEAEVAQLNGEILARDGYEVRVAASARDAIALLHQGSYDLVLSDLNMPDIDGRGFFDAIAAEFPDLVACTAFITGDTMGRSSQGFLEESGRPFLEKPVSPRELCDFVAGLLGARR